MVGLGAICGLLAVVFLVTQFDQLTAGGEDSVDLGQPVFSIGAAEDVAEAIATQGPLLLPDAARGDRDIWVQHLGTDPTEGWLAFAVRPAGAPRECAVEWLTDDRTFVDSCDGTVYPEDGDGLQQYAVSVDPSGDLIVNLNTDS